MPYSARLNTGLRSGDSFLKTFLFFILAYDHPGWLCFHIEFEVYSRLSILQVRIRYILLIERIVNLGGGHRLGYGTMKTTCLRPSSVIWHMMRVKLRSRI